MIQDKCNHEWKKHTNSRLQEGVGFIPAYFICDRCRTEMSASEVFQLEELEKQNKNTRIALYALIVSILAIIVSILKR